MRSPLLAICHVAISASMIVLLAPTFVRATPGGQVGAQIAGLRLPFIANQGQVDSQVAYYAPTFAGTLFVTQKGELVYALRSAVIRAPGRRGSRLGADRDVRRRPGLSAWAASQPDRSQLLRR